MDTVPPAGSNTVRSAGGMDGNGGLAAGVAVRSMKSVKPPKLVRVSTQLPGVLTGRAREGGEQSIEKSLRFEKLAPVVVSELRLVVPLEMETQTPPETLLLAQSTASTAKSIGMPGVAAATW